MLSADALNQVVQAMTPVVEGLLSKAMAGFAPAPSQEAAPTSGEQPVDNDAGEPNPATQSPSKESPMADDAKSKTDDERETSAKYQKERDELRIRYAALEREHGDLKVEYAKLRAEKEAETAEKLKAIRYQALATLQREGYVFDLPEEAAECAALSDAEFESHKQRIVKRYQRVPFSRLPQEASRPFPSGDSEDAAAEQRLRYSKAARELATRSQNSGKPMTYSEALAQVESQAAANGKPQLVG